MVNDVKQVAFSTVQRRFFEFVDRAGAGEQFLIVKGDVKAMMVSAVPEKHGRSKATAKPAKSKQRRKSKR